MPNKKKSQTASRTTKRIDPSTMGRDRHENPILYRDLNKEEHPCGFGTHFGDLGYLGRDYNGEAGEGASDLGNASHYSSHSDLFMQGDMVPSSSPGRVLYHESGGFFCAPVDYDVELPIRISFKDWHTAATNPFIRREL